MTRNNLNYRQWTDEEVQNLKLAVVKQRAELGPRPPKIKFWKNVAREIQLEGNEKRSVAACVHRWAIANGSPQGHKWSISDSRKLRKAVQARSYLARAAGSFSMEEWKTISEELQLSTAAGCRKKWGVMSTLSRQESKEKAEGHLIEKEEEGTEAVAGGVPTKKDLCIDLTQDTDSDLDYYPESNPDSDSESDFEAGHLLVKQEPAVTPAPVESNTKKNKERETCQEVEQEARAESVTSDASGPPEAGPSGVSRQEIAGLRLANEQQMFYVEVEARKIALEKKELANMEKRARLTGDPDKLAEMTKKLRSE